MDPTVDHRSNDYRPEVPDGRHRENGAATPTGSAAPGATTGTPTDAASTGSTAPAGGAEEYAAGYRDGQADTDGPADDASGGSHRSPGPAS